MSTYRYAAAQAHMPTCEGKIVALVYEGDSSDRPVHGRLIKKDEVNEWAVVPRGWPELGMTFRLANVCRLDINGKRATIYITGL